MVEPVIQLQISKSGSSVWAVLVMNGRDGKVIRKRFGAPAAVVKGYINRYNGCNYVTFTAFKSKEQIKKENNTLLDNSKT